MSDETAVATVESVGTAVDAGLKRRMNGVNKSWANAKRNAKKWGCSVLEARTRAARIRRGLTPGQLQPVPIAKAVPAQAENGMPAGLIELNQKAQAFIKIAGSKDNAKRLIDLCFPG